MQSVGRVISQWVFVNCRNCGAISPSDTVAYNEDPEHVYANTFCDDACLKAWRVTSAMEAEPAENETCP